MIDYFILAFFACWFVATAAYQIGKNPVHRLDWLGFIPSCRFFAPNPLITDIRVHYRAFSDESKEAEEDVWRPLLEVPRFPARALWNPGHRLQKSVNVMVPYLLRLQTRTDHIEYTGPYLRLLNVATSRARERGERYTQFLVTRHRGLASPSRQLMFRSKPHLV
jgi:hypothetical protein